MLRPHPTPKEIQRDEQALSRAHNPDIWNLIDKSGRIPHELKVQCVRKHDLEYNYCRFYIYETYTPKHFIMLMCVHKATLYENRGSGWYYAGEPYQTIRHRRHRMHKA